MRRFVRTKSLAPFIEESVRHWREFHLERYSADFKDQAVSSLFQKEGSKFVQLSFPAGQGLTKHRTNRHLVLIVLSGRIRFTVDERSEELAASQIVALEPLQEHSLEAVEPSTALLVLVADAPVQADAPKLQTPALDHENAYMNPALVEQIAPELRPLVSDHVELCKILEAVQKAPSDGLVQHALATVRQELASHFVAEEELLFPLMAKHVGGMDVGPVARLLEEHQKIRRLHTEAQEIFDTQLRQPDEHVKNLMSEKLRELSHALLNHIGKEDSHLFPMASRLLSEAEKQSVADGLVRYEHARAQ